jgi:hypothetical protein
MTGAQGVQGATGVAGSIGETGSQGATGVAGTAGETGSQGATGATGIAGSTGATGPAGPGTNIETFQITSSTPGIYYPTLVTGTTGQTAGISNTSSNLFSFNPSTGIISVTGGYTGGAIFTSLVNSLSLGVGGGANGDTGSVAIGTNALLNVTAPNNYNNVAMG